MWLQFPYNKDHFLLNYSSFSMPYLTDTGLFCYKLTQQALLSLFQEPVCFESHFSVCCNVTHEPAVTIPSWLGNAKALAIVFKTHQLQEHWVCNSCVEPFLPASLKCMSWVIKLNVHRHFKLHHQPWYLYSALSKHEWLWLWHWCHLFSCLNIWGYSQTKEFLLS